MYDDDDQAACLEVDQKGHPPMQSTKHKLMTLFLSLSALKLSIERDLCILLKQCLVIHEEQISFYSKFFSRPKSAALNVPNFDLVGSS